MAQKDGGCPSAGAEERQGAGGAEGGDQVPEDAGGGAGAKHPLAGGGRCSATQGETTFLLHSVFKKCLQVSRIQGFYCHVYIATV